MKVFAPLLLAAGVSARGISEQNPIPRVVELIEGLKAEIVKDGKAEQATYDKFACWCEDTLAEKAKAIDQAKEDIARLSNEIKQLSGSIATLKADLKQVAIDIADNIKSQEEATAMRQTEHDEYTATREDAEAATKALKSATDVLNGAGAKSLAQEVQTLSVVAGVKRALKALPKDSLTSDEFAAVENFVANPASVNEKKAPSFLELTNNPHGDYAPASTAIQGILKNMYDTFTSNLQSGNEEEATKQKDFEELMAIKKAELEALQNTKLSKEGTLGEQKNSLSEKSLQRSETEEQLKADEAFFAETTSSCQTKASEWAERTRLRTEELQGIEEAVKILQGGADIFEESTQFIQFRSVRDVRKDKAVAVLKKLATSTHSLRLAALFATVRTTGHFDKIIEKIDGLIRTLRQEDKDDIAHKEMCDDKEAQLDSRDDAFAKSKEDAKAEKERTQKAKDAAQADKEAREADQKSTEEQLEQALATRTEMNEEFKAARKADAQAVELITQAIASLMKFYKNNKPSLVAKFNELARHVAEPAPGTWDKGYGGRKSENTGVVAILEMIKEDVVNEMKEASKDEKESADAYWAQRKDMEASLKKTKQSIVSLNKKMAEQSAHISNLEDAMTADGEKLDANSNARDAFVQDCNWTKTNFDSRKQKRADELEGLQQAKSALQGAIEERSFGGNV